LHKREPLESGSEDGSKKTSEKGKSSRRGGGARVDIFRRVFGGGKRKTQGGLVPIAGPSRSRQPVWGGGGKIVFPEKGREREQKEVQGESKEVRGGAN